MFAVLWLSKRNKNINRPSEIVGKFRGKRSFPILMCFPEMITGTVTAWESVF